MMLELTPSQTVGPFFYDALLSDPWNVLIEPDTEGERIRIEGHVYDGDGAGVSDGMVEIWQANARGRYRHDADPGPEPLDPAFTGFGRAGTDEGGGYWFETIKPGPVSWGPEGYQAPHINVHVFARGLLDHLWTRLYFEDEEANEQDPLLGIVGADRAPTLLGRRSMRKGKVVYNFDVVLQGERETVFFDA